MSQYWLNMADQKLFELIHDMTGYMILDTEAFEIIQVAKEADRCLCEDREFYTPYCPQCGGKVKGEI